MAVRLLVTLAAVALLAADAAHACRCAPRPLADYFGAADLVVVGRAVETWIEGGELPRRRVRFDGARAFKGDVAAFDGFATPVSSSACGCDIEVGREYVIFSSRRTDDRLAWFDLCSGSRSIDFAAAEGAHGFDDVPAADVLPRLAALRERAAGADPRASATAVLPLPGDPHARLVGLLELPGLLPSADGTPALSRSIVLRAAPADGAAPLATVRAPAELATREYDYEAPGAVVTARRDGWYRLRLADGRDGWLDAAAAGRFHPLAELVVNRLNYLTRHWDGWIWPAAGAGHPQVGGRRVPGDEQPARVLAAESIADTLWLQVEILDRDPCADGEARVVHAGWVPAYTPSGELIAWFHSRGC